MRHLVSALTAFASVTALAAPALAQSAPVLAFNADWSITQSAPLVAGQQAIFRYDTSRLPSCRATTDGVQAWAIEVLYQADASSTVPDLAVTTGNTPGDPIDVPFTVPYGVDLSVWFHNSDDAGCSTYDSDYGQNFHFAIQGPPTVHFDVNWSDQVAGTLQAGASLAVDYDVRRLSTCRGTYGSSPAWGVTVFYSFDGGAVGNAPLTESSGGILQVPAVIATPAGAHQVALWFQNTDVDGCSAWDSDYGQNYTFTLQ